MMETTRMPVGQDTMSSGLRSASNYHQWTFGWIGPHVHGRVLDIGGGTGNHLKYLEQHEIVSLDVSSDAVEELRSRFASRSNWSFQVGDVTNPSVVDELGRSAFQTVLSCNVFEHIDNDRAAFTNAFELLRPGGAIVLVLPAHQALFGDMDRLAGHFRRYDKKMVEDRLLHSGFRSELVRYVNLVGAIGWFVNSRFARHRDLSSGAINTQIGAFDRFLVPVLRRLEGPRPMPFGQSLVCVGRKPG